MISGTEILANLVTTLSILLAGRNSVHTWWTGILGCLLFTVVFLDARLYADVTLQCFFVLASLAGWKIWRNGAAGQTLPVTRCGMRLSVWAILAGITATLGYGALLQHFTNAYAPFVDSAILAFSIIAQVLLIQRRVETWPLWLLVNSLAVPLYAGRGLYLTAFLYAAYWINAMVSWRHWQRLERSALTA